jgi:hypothetical protein
MEGSVTVASARVEISHYFGRTRGDKQRTRVNGYETQLIGIQYFLEVLMCKA